jgi:hypothetical protein
MTSCPGNPACAVRSITSRLSKHTILSSVPPSPTSLPLYATHITPLLGRSQLLTFVPALQPKQEEQGGFWGGLSYYLSSSAEDPRTAEEEEQASATIRLRSDTPLSHVCCWYLFVCEGATPKQKDMHTHRALVERCGVAQVLSDSKLLPSDALTALVMALTRRAGLVQLSQQAVGPSHSITQHWDSITEGTAPGLIHTALGLHHTAAHTTQH